MLLGPRRSNAQGNENGAAQRNSIVNPCQLPCCNAHRPLKTGALDCSRARDAKLSTSQASLAIAGAARRPSSPSLKPVRSVGNGVWGVPRPGTAPVTSNGCDPGRCARRMGSSSQSRPAGTAEIPARGQRYSAGSGPATGFGFGLGGGTRRRRARWMESQRRDTVRSTVRPRGGCPCRVAAPAAIPLARSSRAGEGWKWQAPRRPVVCEGEQTAVASSASLSLGEVGLLAGTRRAP
jgi:hypothetical protein